MKLLRTDAWLGVNLGKYRLQIFVKLSEKRYNEANMIMTEALEITKPLDIGYKRACNCPPSHINCLTPKEWVRSQVAIWEFSYEKRDIRDKKIHPAVFPIALPTKCIKLFTHEGELVLDPFVGIGTTLIAAQDLNRNAVGFDLKEDYIELAKSRLSQPRLFSKAKQIAIRDDARNIPQYLREQTVALVVTSPPYANMLNKPRLNKSMRSNLRKNEHYFTTQQYSNDQNDLGTIEPIKFAETLGEIYKGIIPLLKTKAHCIINLNDLWWENKRIPSHIYVIEALERVGYELRNIIIWDKRNLVNRVGIFGWPSNYIKLGTTFEYILDFWKPET
jgi:DNA modification methylase